MSITFGCIKKDIANPGTGYVLMFGRNVGKYYAGGNLGANPRHRRLPEVRFSKVGKSEQPQHGLRDSSEYPKPSSESGGFNLDPSVIGERSSEEAKVPCIID